MKTKVTWTLYKITSTTPPYRVIWERRGETIREPLIVRVERGYGTKEELYAAAVGALASANRESGGRQA